MMQRSVRSLISKLPKSPKSPKSISKSLPKPSKSPQIPPKSNLSTFSRSISSIQSHKLIENRRSFATGGVGNYNAEIDEINLKFAEAREEIDAALESKETVYFDEEAECAREAVKVVLDKFQGLLARLDEKERTAVQRSMGLKMEQLKAELQQLED